MCEVLCKFGRGDTAIRLPLLMLRMHDASVVYHPPLCGPSAEPAQNLSRPQSMEMKDRTWELRRPELESQQYHHLIL